MRVEISVESLAGVRIAASAGADRVELCSGLAVGGLTPGAALIEQAVGAGVPVHVLIRPRPGGFVYAPDEVATMARDIALARSLGAAGVVVGALDTSGEVDEPACAAFVEAAAGAQVTFHRAIDVCADPARTLDRAVALGFTHILTSGRHRTALDGAPVIHALRVRAAGAIEVMACGGIRAANAIRVIEITGVSDLHAAPLTLVDTPTPAGEVSFGPHHETDPAEVAALCSLVKSSRG